MDKNANNPAIGCLTRFGCFGVFLLVVVIIASISQCSYNSQNAVEFTSSLESGKKAYVDIVTIEPRYGKSMENSNFVYEVICKCTTKDNSIVWISMSVSDYNEFVDDDADFGGGGVDKLTAAEFGDAKTLRVGDAVVAIGDPLGMELRGSMTDGIISAINRDVTTGGRTLTLIQTNAALNSGNSGGPLINCYGQVIGINTMKMGVFTSQSGTEGLGFAIPSSTVKEIADQLISQGYVSGRPGIGITGEEVSGFYQFYYQLPAGLYITHLEQGSDAAAKGITEGDILISLDDRRITTQEALREALLSYEVGDTVRIVIFRSGRQYAADITLHEAKG